MSTAEPSPAAVAAFVPDLMDRSKVSAAAPATRFVRRVTDLLDADADLLVVDLSRAGVLDVLAGLGGRRVVGFGSHVDRDLLAAAHAAGAEVMARSAFFARLAEVLGGDGQTGRRRNPVAGGATGGETGRMDLIVDDLRAMDPEDLAAVAALNAAVQGEVHAERPVSTETMASRMTAPSTASTSKVVRAVADDGELLGIALVEITVGASNQHLADIAVEVAGHRRRQGVGRALLGRAAAVAAGAGRTSLVGGSLTHVPAGAAFAAAVGAKKGLVLRLNRLTLADVDRGLLQRWVAAAEGGDYELLFIDGRCPDDLIDEVINVGKAMNDAPRDDLDVEDDDIGPEHYRDWESASLTAGYRRWALYARHIPTGRLAGWTNVRTHPEQPDTVQQGGTGVLPAHRGHRLGRWLKAAMLLEILDRLPDAHEVRTDNAHTNDHMLAINDALGFTPYGDEVIWQVDAGAVGDGAATR